MRCVGSSATMPGRFRCGDDDQRALAGPLVPVRKEVERQPGQEVALGAAEGEFVVDQAGLKVPAGDGRQFAGVKGLAPVFGVQSAQVGEARLQEEPEGDVLDAAAAVDRSPAAVAVEDDSGTVMRRRGCIRRRSDQGSDRGPGR